MADGVRLEKVDYCPGGLFVLGPIAVRDDANELKWADQRPQDGDPVLAQPELAAHDVGVEDVVGLEEFRYRSGHLGGHVVGGPGAARETAVLAALGAFPGYSDCGPDDPVAL